MGLQTPSVLAQLPRPLHASTGQTRIGEVSSLVDSKKRKRYEVVVAVDGEAVNIYNVRGPSCWDYSLSLLACLLTGWLLGSNAETGDLLRCSSPVDLLLSTLFSAAQSSQQVVREETNIRCCQSSRASDQVFCRADWREWIERACDFFLIFHRDRLEQPNGLCRRRPE